MSLEMKLLSLFVRPGRSALTQLTSLSWKRRTHCVLLSLLSSTNELELAAAVVYLLMKVRICSGATHTHNSKSEHVCTANVQALNSRNNLSFPSGKKKNANLYSLHKMCVCQWWCTADIQTIVSPKCQNMPLTMKETMKMSHRIGNEKESATGVSCSFISIPV